MSVFFLRRRARSGMIKDENAEKGQNRDGEKHTFFYGKIPRRGIFSPFPQRCLTVKFFDRHFFCAKAADHPGPSKREGRNFYAREHRSHPRRAAAGPAQDAAAGRPAHVRHVRRHHPGPHHRLQRLRSALEHPDHPVFRRGGHPVLPPLLQAEGPCLPGLLLCLPGRL